MGILIMFLHTSTLDPAVVTHNLLLKIFNWSSSFSELGIMLCHYEITHACSTSLYATEVI